MRRKNAEEILFGEFFTPSRRASLRSKVTELCNSVSQGVKNLFPNHEVVEETTQPELNLHDSESIRQNFPIVCQYVHEITSAPASPPPSRGQESPRSDDFTKSIERLAVVYDKILQHLQAIDARRNALILKKRAVHTDRDSAPRCRAALILCLSLKNRVLKAHEKYIEDVKHDMTYVLNYVNAKQRENPDVELTVDVQALLDRLDGFPTLSPEARTLKRHQSMMKAYYGSLIRSPPQQIPVSKRLHALFFKCEKLIDPQTQYFRDRSDDLIEFENVLRQMKKPFIERLNERVEKCVVEPQLIGAAILEQSADLAKTIKVDYEKTLPVWFVLFSRVFFDRIYVKTLAAQPLSSAAVEFQRRVYRIRKLTPVAIGAGAEFLGAKLKTLRLIDFPKMHLYSAAVAVFAQLSYVVCPIDFCKAANDALSVVQAQAQAFSFTEYLHTTGCVGAESDHALSLDQLFDIGIIVFLLADPVDVLTLVEHFGKFVGALQLPSAFQFGFTNIKAMCDYVMKLDMNKFLEEARQRQDLDQEIDPLNILAK